MLLNLCISLCLSAITPEENQNNLSNVYSEKTKQIAKKFVKYYKISKEKKKKNFSNVEEISFPTENHEQEAFIKDMISPYYKGDIELKKLQPGAFSKFLYMIYAIKKETINNNEEIKKTPLFVLKEISDLPHFTSEQIPVSQMTRMSSLPFDRLDRWGNFGIIFPEKLFIDRSMKKEDEASSSKLRHEGFALLHVAKGEDFIDYFNKNQKWNIFMDVGKAYMKWILKVDQRINPRAKHASFFDIQAYTHGDFHFTNIMVNSKKDYVDYYLIDTGTISQNPHTFDYILKTDMLRMFFISIDQKEKAEYIKASIVLKKFLSGCAEILSSTYGQEACSILDVFYKEIFDHLDNLNTREDKREKSDDFMTKDMFYAFKKEFETIKKFMIKVFENKKY